MGSEWVEGSFKLKFPTAKGYIRRKGWTRGTWGIHVYWADNHARNDDEPERINVFALTHLPTGCRMAGAFSLENVMEICGIIDAIEDWSQLDDNARASEPRWQAARDKIVAALTAAAYGHMIEHCESRVFVKLGTQWPPEQATAQ